MTNTQTKKKPLPLYMENEIEDASRSACSGCRLETYGSSCRHQPLVVYTLEGAKISTDNIDLLVVGDTPTYLDNKAKEFLADDAGRDFIRKVKRLGFTNFAVMPAVRCYVGGEVDHYVLNKKYKGSNGRFQKETPLERAKEAVKNCKSYVETAVREYNPKLTLAMGPLATEALGLSGTVPALRVQPLHPKSGFSAKKNEGIVVTYDRFQTDGNDWSYRDLVRDVAKLRHIANSGFSTRWGDEKDLQVTVLDTVEAVRGFVDRMLTTKFENQEILCFDFETANLDLSTETNKILNVGFALSSEPQKAFVVPLAHPETPFDADQLTLVYRLLKKLFASKGASFYAWLGHYIQFELSIVKLFFGVWLGEAGNIKTMDTMTLMHSYDEERRTKGINKPYALETLASELLGFRWYTESKIKSARDNLEAMPIEQVNHYVGVDACVTALCLNQILDLMEEEGSAADLLRVAVKLYSRAKHYVTDLKVTGQYLDRPLLQMLRAKDSSIGTRIREIEEEFAASPEVQQALELIGEGKKSGGLKALFKTPNQNKFNFASPEHRKALFWDVMQLEGADESVDKTFQERHKNVILVKLFAEHQSLTKLDSSYLEPLALWLQSPNSVDGRVRPTFNLINTKTGRLSASDPPTQTVPRSDSRAKKQIKSIFRAPKGKVLVQLDFSQAEVRWLGIMSGDEALAEKYRRADEISEALLKDPTNQELIKAKKIDGDLHMSTAIMMYKLPADFPLTNEKEAKMYRQRAKTICFGLIYGKNYKSLAKDLGISEDEALEAVELWLSQFPKAAAWLEETERLAAERGYVRSPFGRWRRLPEVFSADQSVVNRALRQSRNTPIQSAASDMCIYAACDLRDALRFSEDPGLRSVKLINTVHDSLIAEVPADPDIIRAYCKLAKSIFTNPNLLKKDFKIDITVPLAVDFDIGLNWGNMHDYDFTEKALARALHDAEVLRSSPTGTLLEDLKGKGVLYDDVHKKSAA